MAFIRPMGSRFRSVRVRASVLLQNEKSLLTNCSRSSISISSTHALRVLSLRLLLLFISSLYMNFVPISSHEKPSCCHTPTALLFTAWY